MKTSKFQPIHFTIQIWTDFHENEGKKDFFFKKKKIKMAYFSKWPFFKIDNSQKILRKFHRSVLGLVGLIDAKVINVAQPIWS